MNQIKENYMIGLNLKIENLEVGKIYTYKQLCELLGVAEKKGGARKSQIEKWWDWFEWEKVTAQKYKVTLVRDIPLERIDGRINNGGARIGAGRPRKTKQRFYKVECMINISYEDIIRHIVSIRLNDLDGIEREDVEREYELRLYDECIGMIRLASIVCDVPFLQVYDDVFDALEEVE